MKVKVLAMLGFVLLACGVYAFLNPGNNLAFSAVSYATCFFDKAVYHGFFNISRLFEDKKELQDEVAELKEEISTLRDDIVSLNELKRQNEEYAKYYEFKKENSSIKFEPASVIFRDVSDNFHNFKIDKGTNDGVSKGDIVLSGEGVVGFVSLAGTICSQVKTFLSPQSKIGVYDTETFESGIITGNPEDAKSNLTRMMFLPEINSVKEGDIVATSATGGIYPKNLKLGKVKSTGYDDKQASYFALIEPFEDFKNLKDVFVVTDFRGKGEILAQN